MASGRTARLWTGSRSSPRSWLGARVRACDRTHEPWRMRIFALLSWYDEHPDHLRRAVASLKGFADVLVAVDGAYATFPDAGPLSPASNWQAITEACVDAGLGFSPHHPYLPAWEGEVAKRAAMFEFGRWAGAT